MGRLYQKNFETMRLSDVLAAPDGADVGDCAECTTGAQKVALLESQENLTLQGACCCRAAGL